MRFRENGKKGRNVLVDISPLIDVVFLLLIFFMVSTTFIEESGLPLDLPSSESKTAKKTEAVSVSISTDGKIYVNNRPVELESLTEEIKQELEQTEKKEVIVKADKDAKYEWVYLVMDCSRQAGVKSLSVAGKVK